MGFSRSGFTVGVLEVSLVLLDNNRAGQVSLHRTASFEAD